eukprot:jgi/Chrzof1/12039/Cz06g19030.t1
MAQLPNALLAIVAVACIISCMSCVNASQRKVLQQAKQAQTRRTTKYTLNVTTGSASPDCFTRRVILINGKFMPTLEVAQGDWLEVKVLNNLPPNYPDVSDGISIHWHGFHLRGFEWYDGAAYTSQCPISKESSFTYKFKVNEAPGSYLWHDHSAIYRADGLQGALIVRPKRSSAGSKQKSQEVAKQPLMNYDAEHTLFLMDWWHFTGNAMAMRLNRPFDDTKATNDTGKWFWVGLPKSILINGKGHYGDCEDVYTRKVNQTLPTGAIANTTDLMIPPGKAGQLGATAAWPTCNVTSFYGAGKKCKHEEVVVQPNTTYLMRIINAATLVYMTVCFEAHHVTVVAMDAIPVQPKTFFECVDVNSGQRVDVLLKTNATADNYWITVASDYRKGAPSGYGVLRYASAPAATLPAAATHPVLQPQEAFEKRKWTISTTNSFKAHPALVSPSKETATAAKAYLVSEANIKVPKTYTRRIVLQSTQPLLESNGILRWALNNVAHADTPACSAMLQDVYDDPAWVTKNAIKAKYNGVSGYFTNGTLTGTGSGVQVLDTTVDGDMLIKANRPSAGTHVVTTKLGEVIELVVINARAGAFGGEYNGTGGSTNRTGREQHPFHLHGHRFWVVGSGGSARLFSQLLMHTCDNTISQLHMLRAAATEDSPVAYPTYYTTSNDSWTPKKVSSYNLQDPVYRDTATLFFSTLPAPDAGGWTALRFVADNPGVWPFHCHITWHMFMGQRINFIEGVKNMTEPPADLPKCKRTCKYNFALYGPKLTNKTFALSGLLAPEASNLS